MKRVTKVIYLLTLTTVLANQTPKFGERIKTDQNNTSLIDLVFRPTESQENKQNQSNTSAWKQSQTDKGHAVGYKLADQQKEKNVDKNNGINSNEKDSERKKLEEKANSELDEKLKESRQQIEKAFHSNPAFDSFEMTFADVPELAGSEQIRGAPIPPPPPQRPQGLSDYQRFHSYDDQDPSYDESGGKQSFYQSAPKPTLDTDFSFNVPQGFPHPSRDQGADYKKEQMGAQNYEGKPWGTKRSYTYRDPKNPHNFMEMSEVTMTINRQMNPQEAQSQIQNFIAAAQSGQYGPASRHSTTADEEQSRGYEPGASHLVPSEPMEPAEPNFPQF